MLTVIQTHLITCKDWATVKDTAKSLEHIIMKCDPPTPAMPTMATSATVPGLYSHIAHLVDKDEGEIPQPFNTFNTFGSTALPIGTYLNYHWERCASINTTLTYEHLVIQNGFVAQHVK